MAAFFVFIPYLLIKQSIKTEMEQLVEIKKGQTGRGLLIEHDGHIIGNCDTIQQIREDIAHHDKFVIPDDFVVYAVFQKYGIKNANGRIYPEAILKREVQKYIENQIKEHRAIGALDHPSCVKSPDTQVLTALGWKKITDINVGDEVLTINEQKKIEPKKVTRTIDEPYAGKMIHFKGRFIDLTVTPNHRFPILNRNQEWKGLYTAQDILEGNIPDQNHSYLFKVGEWHDNSDEVFVLPGLTEEEIKNIPSKSLREKYVNSVDINMETWMKFMGIYLSEGDSCYQKPNGKRSGRVNIHQKKKEIIDEIDAMLSEMPFECKKYERKNGSCTFSIYDLRLAKYLTQFGKCYDKYIPNEIKKQGKSMLKVFYDWFVMGDGRKRGIGKGKYYSDDVFSTSKRLVMDLNEIQLKIGYNGVYHSEDRHIDRIIEDRLIKAENSNDMHFTFRSHSKNVVLNSKSLSVTEEEYDGHVYCLEVEDNHTFYMMDDSGHCLWSGNSSTLSGHDVTHNILDLRWEGRTLVGEMKLHLSPGYKRYGVCSTSGDLVANMILDGIQVGVSSRAVGSVEQKMGVLVVGDDLELVGWDVVMEPSTSNAWISTNYDGLQPFIESDGQKSMKPSINEKLTKISNILS
jgi:hypothetical protein